MHTTDDYSLIWGSNHWVDFASTELAMVTNRQVISSFLNVLLITCC